MINSRLSGYYFVLLTKSAFLRRYLNRIYRTVSKVPKDVLRSSEGFLFEFNTKNTLNHLKENAIEFQMQSLWIRETILRKYPGLRSFGEFNLFKNLFIRINATKHMSNGVQNYLTNNFKKLCTLWLKSLEIQTRHLAPLHASTLDNLFDFVNYLKCVAERCVKQNAEKYASIYVQLLKICLHEMSRASSELKACPNLDKNFSAFLLDKIQSLMGPLLDADFSSFPQLDSPNNEEEKSPFFDSSIDYDQFEKLNKQLSKFYQMLVYILDSTYVHNIERTHEFGELMRKIVHVNMKQAKSNTLRMVAMVTRPKSFVDDLGLVDKFLNHKPSVVLNTSLIEYVLKAGCDADSLIDEYSSRNTFLNEGLFRSESTGALSVLMCDNLITLFLKYGARLDISNENGLTVVDQYQSKFDCQLTHLIKLMEHSSLKGSLAH